MCQIHIDMVRLMQPIMVDHYDIVRNMDYPMNNFPFGQIFSIEKLIYR